MNSASMVDFVHLTIKEWLKLAYPILGDDSKFDLNAGKFISSKWLVRGGIFESELGVGVDYNLRGPVSLSAAMYDLNHRKYPYFAVIYVYIKIPMALFK